MALVEPLRRVRFFEDLTPEDLQRISEIGRRRSFQPGEAMSGQVNYGRYE